MAWQGIEGHDEIVERLRRGLAAGRLAGSFLFVGPSGIGKRTLALKLAQTLLCQRRPATELTCCGECQACQQAAAQTHPDLEYIRKPPDKSRIPVELLIGDKQHRMREGLCARLATTPAAGGRKIAIIDDADYLGREGANCLLKTLEEPPPRAVLILIGTSAQRQLPTIRSRCKIMSFRPLDHDTITQLCLDRKLVADEAAARAIALASDGTMERAAILASADIAAFRHAFHRALADDFEAITLAAQVTEFVESAGKEASARRVYLKLATEMAAEYFRGVLRKHYESPDEKSTTAAGYATPSWPIDPAALATCIDRCLVAYQHVDSNANQATNIDAWIADLEIICGDGIHDWSLQSV